MKASLGEAGAFFDESSGYDNLFKILQAIASAGGPPLSVKTVSPTTGIKASLVCDVKTRLGTLYVKVGTTGSAGATTVQVLKNGVALTDVVTVDNAEADGVYKGIAFDDEQCDSGDLIEINFSAVATSAANVTATLRFAPVLVET